ncbi:MAG: hypothetical protein KDA75_05630 [Planctomycetaceae bacterium]|nr:hypothetical protein [Planctomycetaceae bacterium]
MPIELSCPNCGYAYTVKDDAAGRRFRCKECGDAVDVPGSTLTEDASAADSLGFDAAADNDLAPGGSGESLSSSGRRRSPRLYNDQLQPSGLGKASLILGCIVWVFAMLGIVAVMGVGFVFAQQAQNDAPDPDQFAAFGALGMGICGVSCLSYLLSLVGGVLALIVLTRPDERKGQAIGGLILNGLYFLGMTGMILLSMIAGNS